MFRIRSCHRILSLHNKNRLSATRQYTAVTSRRAYNRLQQQAKQPNTKESATKNTSSAANDDTTKGGWPNSVRYTGYALASTLGPYSVLWLVANTPSLHDYLTESQREWLRNQFGIPEHDQENTLLMKNKDTPLPIVKKLPMEPTWRERLIAQEQNALNDMQLDVNVTIYSNDATSDNTSSSSTVTIQVPASVLAKADELQKYLADALNGNMSSLSRGSIIGIDFPSPSRQQDGSMTEMDDSSSALYKDHDESVENESTTSAPDPLLKQTAVFSSWHYDSNANNAANANTGTSPLVQQQSQSLRSSSDRESLMQQLQADIYALEAELHQRHHASMRDVDDITNELQHKKAELRRLKWGKWVPW
ncbi:hypothetical protein MPSEU_000624800 [Mayamaea pseudoterrestris]|nr:hypothetical protein MPSEU_000624800 [Mayamaea pseudoterrestris]